MAFGVDTASYLTDIDWSKFYNWKGKYPTFAGRYFGGKLYSKSGEFSSAKNATGGVLNTIIPIQASVVSNQQATGQNGYNYGVADANETLGNVANFLTSKELGYPSTLGIYVYLDIEAGTNLSVDYWAGWANKVWNYMTPDGKTPFWPAIYCQFTSTNGKYVPNSNIQYVLNNTCSSYPNDHTQCYAFWTSSPEYCSNCSPTATPDWSVFGSFTQTCGNINYTIPIFIWQYVETSTCLKTCNISDYAGGQNLDMDDTDSQSTLSYELIIK